MRFNTQQQLWSYAPILIYHYQNYDIISHMTLECHLPYYHIRRLTMFSQPIRSVISPPSFLPRNKGFQLSCIIQLIHTWLEARDSVHTNHDDES